MNIAILLPNWVGDVVMATPTLRAMRERFADAHLIGVMRPYVAEVLAGTKWLDEQLFYDPRSKKPDVRVVRLIRQLRTREIDTALLLPNSFRTGLLAYLSGARRRVGYAQYGRGPLLTDKLKFEKRNGRFVPAPTLDTYLRLAKLLGCEPKSIGTELATTTDDEQAADRVWGQLGLPTGSEVVVLNSGGAYGAAKSWPVDYFGQLARRIAQQHALSVLVMCGPKERQLAAQIALQANHRHVVSLADQPLSVGLSKACVRRARLMVSTDSGPRHFAAAFDVPVITLYGPTHVAWGDTHYARAIHLQEDVPCGPCMKRVCPEGHHRCMRDLTVHRVYGEVAKQLGQPRQVEAA
jgi:heptosyltransferase-2